MFDPSQVFGMSTCAAWVAQVPAAMLAFMNHLISILAALALAGCAADSGDELTSAAATPRNDLNLVNAPIPQTLQAAQLHPYAVPMDMSCTSYAAEISSLDEVLGPDLDTPVTEANRGLIERGTDAAGGAAVGALRRPAEGVIPFRGWVRKLTGAERYSKRVAAAIAAGTVRRAFLKGLGVARRATLGVSTVPHTIRTEDPTASCRSVCRVVCTERRACGAYAWLHRWRLGVCGSSGSIVAFAHAVKLPVSNFCNHFIILKTMRLFTIATAITVALFVGGCATKPAGGSGSASAPATTAAARISTPVVVPAVSARSVVMSMTGSKQVVEAKDWAGFKREWRDTFSDHAKAAGITFTFVDGDIQPQGQDGTMLLVNVADYRMVGIGARIMFGIMTGNAFIDARIRFANLRDGAAFGEQQYNTSSSAAGGVFAKVTPQQVDMIGAEVFGDLKAAR
jgi:PBP1b-binding outer membrane lipoprotein LpoB